MLDNDQRSLGNESSYHHNSESILIHYIYCGTIYSHLCYLCYLVPLPGHVTNQFVLLLLSERKIDQIEARLGNIEGLLKNISNSRAIDTSKFIHTPATTDLNIPTASSNADYDSASEESALGGDSGLTVHTAFASEFLERAVKRAPLRALNPKMETALANLSQLVDMQKKRSISHGPRFPFQQPVPPGGVSKLTMPPVATVVSLLKHVKSKLILLKSKMKNILQ